MASTFCISSFNRISIVSSPSIEVPMGSKRKSEKKSKDEGGSKRRRTESDEDGSSRSMKSHRKEKLHKHRSDKDKKSKDDHKGKHRKKDRILIHDFQELSSDDYFLKNNEFSTWLKEEKDVFFSDLSSESARSLFEDFVKVWNRQRLEARYYEGITTAPRSAHSWKIRS